jgi:hypothetical protein
VSIQDTVGGYYGIPVRILVTMVTAGSLAAARQAATPPMM